MFPKPRVSVRKLMVWVGVIAVLLALGRYPYYLIRAQRRFAARWDEGNALVQSYYAQCPTSMDRASWNEAVSSVQIAWGNVVLSPEHFPDEHSIDRILAQMRSLVAQATPSEAEGDLYLILDLLAHARTKASVAYLSERREAVRKSLHGYGQPSPALAGYALRWVGPSEGITALVTIAEGLRVNDWMVRVACCRGLGQFGLGLGSPAEAESAITALIRALDNDDPLVREIAVECLHEMGPKAASARDALIQKLRQDPGVRVRWQAARTLTQVGKDGKAVIPTLIATIGDEDCDVRVMAISSLAELKSKAIEAVPALCEALNDHEYRVRRAAVEALVNISPSSDAVLASLLNVLKSDPEWQVRDKTAGALGQLGPAGAAAVPALVDALRRDNAPNVRRASALALARVGPPGAMVLAGLTQSLQHDRIWFVRQAAAAALGEIGPSAASAVPVLIEARKDPAEMVRTAVTESLGKIGADSRRSITVLIELLADEYPRTRQAALQSLGRFGPEARAAAPLIKAIRDAPADEQADYVVAAAVAALRKIIPQP